MSSETALDFRGLDITEIEGIILVFTISLLGAIIQDSGMKERCDHVRVEDSGLYLFLFIFSDLGLGFSMISHMTVTNCHKSQSHNHMSHKTL